MNAERAFNGTAWRSSLFRWANPDRVQADSPTYMTSFNALDFRWSPATKGLHRQIKELCYPASITDRM